MELKLCAFADEYSQSLDEQIKALTEHGIPYLEMRFVDGKNITEWTPEDAKGWKKKLDAAGIRVWSMGSPIGKVRLTDDFDAHLTLAENVFRMANVLECKNVRIFSFFTEDYAAVRDTVIERLGKLIALADRYGVHLYHENEKDIFGDRADRCLALLEALPALGCVFDPANFVQCNEDIPYALSLLRAHTDYYHIKDAMYEDGAVVPAGCGDGCLEKVLRGIEHDTVLTLEPHLSVFEGYSLIDSSALAHRFTYKSAADAFSAAVDAIKELLKKIGYTEEERAWKK